MHRTPTLSRSAQTLSAFALIAASAACVDFGPSVPLDFNLDGYPGCGVGCFYIDFQIYPEQQNFLRGDSVELYTISTKGWDNAAWSSSGAAITLIRPDGTLHSTITSARRAWVKGLFTGSGTVQANAVGAEYSDTSVFLVADSSDITEMRAYGIVAGSPVNVGVPVYIDVVMLDANGSSFRAMPTGWSASDTTIVRLSPPTPYLERLSRFTLVPKQPGNVTLTFSFLAVRKTLEITIVQ